MTTYELREQTVYCVEYAIPTPTIPDEFHAAYQAARKRYEELTNPTGPFEPPINVVVRGDEIVLGFTIPMPEFATEYGEPSSP